MPYDSEMLDKLVTSMEARSVSVTFSCKVSVKEDSGLFRGVESGMTVSLRVPGLEAMPLEVVRLAALKHAPMLASKVYTDLVLGDVMSATEAGARIQKVTEFYEAAYQRMLHGTADTGVGDAGVRDVERAAPGPDA